MKTLFCFYTIDFTKSNIAMAFRQSFDPRSHQLTDVCDAMLCTKKQAKQRVQFLKEMKDNANLVRDYRHFDVEQRARTVARNLVYLKDGDPI